MARLWYGGTPADFAIAQGAQDEILDESAVGTGDFGAAMLLPIAIITFDVYTDAALSAVTTDLLDETGNPITEILSAIEFDDRGTTPRFQGPDGHEGPLWLSADAVTGFRFDPDSGALYGRVGAAEAALAAATVDIIPVEDEVISIGDRLDLLETVPDSPDVQFFSADGTWTKPDGALRVFVEVHGGGGAGGGAAITTAGQSSEGSGGGGGGYGAEWFDADDLTDTVSVVVGAGGTGVSGDDGNFGEASEFEGYFGADGGDEGFVGTPSSGTSIITGGNGGSTYDAGSGLPSITRNGGDGGAGIVIGGNSYRLNSGGSSQGAGEVNLTSATSSGTGQAGSANGGGGSGARNAASQGATRAGGAGGAGFVQVTTHF